MKNFLRGLIVGVFVIRPLSELVRIIWCRLLDKLFTPTMRYTSYGKSYYQMSKDMNRRF